MHAGLPLAAIYILAYISDMKILFEIPTPLAKRFKASVPSGKRSALVARLLEKALANKAKTDEEVCRRVNRLKRLSTEMTEWERFNDSDAL